MQDWDLSCGLLVIMLGAVMLLDAMPLVGLLVPGDLAVLAAVGLSPPGVGAGTILIVIAGYASGWSLTFLVGRHFGERMRNSRLGAWIGETRWAAAERALGHGGDRLVLVTPFLPVLNALLPLAAGGLRMPYRRFVGWSTIGAALWAGLYVLLGTVARSLGGFLPGEPFALLITTGIGLLLGWIVLLGVRKRLRTVGVR